MKKMMIEIPISVGIVNRTRLRTYPPMAYASWHRREGVPARHPFPIDENRFGHELSHTVLRRPVLKSSKATYMPCTRLRTTWNFCTCTSPICGRPVMIRF